MPFLVNSREEFTGQPPWAHSEQTGYGRGLHGLRIPCQNNELTSMDRDCFQWIIKYLQSVNFVKESGSKMLFRDTEKSRT